MPALDDDDLNMRFTYHAPGKGSGDRHDLVRNACQELASYLIAETTLSVDAHPSREQALVVTHIEEAMFWANAHIARHQGD